MIYDRKTWENDRMFAASPGQQVSREVYEEMLNCMPPLHLSEEAKRKAEGHGLYVSAGFMMGEPHSSDAQGTLYSAFGRHNENCYYLGIAHVGR